MDSGILIGGLLAAAAVSSLITYLLTRLRMEKAAAEQSRIAAEAAALSAERDRALAEALAAVEQEKARFELAARGIEENARRKALDEFLADLHVEERHYVREHRLLFAHRKSLVLQERIFFRNVPISNWVEHEVPVEEGADVDSLAKTLSVFDALEGGDALSRTARKIAFPNKRSAIG